MYSSGVRLLAHKGQVSGGMPQETDRYSASGSTDGIPDGNLASTTSLCTRQDCTYTVPQTYSEGFTARKQMHAHDSNGTRCPLHALYLKHGEVSGESLTSTQRMQG